MDGHTIVVLIEITFLGFVCGWVNATLGMGYGTILSPVLIILGYNPLTAVPAVLISQGVSALFSSYFHHGLENVDLSHSAKTGKISEDLRSGIWIAVLGVIAVWFASYISVRLISKETLSTYIGVVVCAMGLLILFFTVTDRTPRYSPHMMKLVALFSAFNKGSSGGGYGMVVTGGQIVSGQKHKKAVGVTMFAEAPICIVGFISYWYLNGITEWRVICALTLGAILASKPGAYTTSRLSHKYLPLIIAGTLILLGSFVLLKRYGFITFSVTL